MLSLDVLGSSSKGNCYILQNNDTRIMLDCGVDHQKILDKYPTCKFDGILITHCHQDHCKGLKKLKNYINCKVYSNDETIEILPILETNKKTVNENESFKIGSFTILPFLIEHDVKNFGYLIKDNISHHKLVYITDCGTIPNYQFKDIDTFLIEANYNEDWLKDKEELEIKEARNLSGKGHLSVQQTTKFLQDNINYNTKYVILGHISSNCKDYIKMQEFVSESLIENNNGITTIALDPNNNGINYIVLKEDIKLW